MTDTMSDTETAFLTGSTVLHILTDEDNRDRPERVFAELATLSAEDLYFLGQTLDTARELVQQSLESRA